VGEGSGVRAGITADGEIHDGGRHGGCARCATDQFTEDERGRYTMNKGEYLMVQGQLLAMAQVARDMPLGEFVRAIERAEALGPLLDPTLYRQASFNMGQVKRLALGLLAFQESVGEVMDG